MLKSLSYNGQRWQHADRQIKEKFNLASNSGKLGKGEIQNN